MSLVAVEKLQKSRQLQAASLLTQKQVIVSAALLSLYASRYPTTHVRELPHTPHICHGPTHWQLLWSSWLRAVCFNGKKGAFSSRLHSRLTVQRKARQLVNCSEVMEKHGLCTSWQINQSQLGNLHFKNTGFNAMLKSFKWISILISPQLSIAEPALLSEQEMNRRHFHEKSCTLGLT